MSGNVGARIVHKLDCQRCRMGWACGGYGIDDVERATVIASLLGEARAERREQIAADALDLVREWTQMDGRLNLSGRDLSDFRDELAAVISGRAR